MDIPLHTSPSTIFPECEEFRESAWSLVKCSRKNLTRQANNTKRLQTPRKRISSETWYDVAFPNHVLINYIFPPSVVIAGDAEAGLYGTLLSGHLTIRSTWSLRVELCTAGEAPDTAKAREMLMARHNIL